MKNLLLILAVALFFAACKKDNNQPLNNTKTPVSAVQKDTASLTINGKLYTYNSKTGAGAANRQANKKLDSISKSGFPYVSSDPDSLMFSKEFTISDSEHNAGAITFTFFKKFAKSDLIFNNGIFGVGIFSPKDGLQFYVPGTYKVPVDFNKWNAHNGVAVEVISSEFFISTFDQTFPGYSDTNISSNAQDDAQFKIVSFKQDEWGYLVEANFTLKLFDRDGKIFKTENGYLKFHVQ